MSVKEFINYLLSLEQYSFSIEEVAHHTGKPRTALMSELKRMVGKKEIVNLRKGYYLIIPPRYSHQGQIPVQLYVEKLFRTLNRKYYLGLFTAARFHGAGHQSIHREYIMIEKPKVRDIKKNQIDIRFFTVANWPEKNIIERKSDAGLFKISSPALTAVDLIQHQSKIGGISRVFTVLEELAEEINLIDVKDLLSWYPNKSTLQRFGFLLDSMGADSQITATIREHLSKVDTFPVLLSPSESASNGLNDTNWKVKVNVRIESDL